MLNLIMVLLHAKSYFHIFCVVTMLIRPKIIKDFLAKNSERARSHIYSSQETKKLLKINAHLIFSSLGILNDLLRIIDQHGRSHGHRTTIFFKITHDANEGFWISKRISIESPKKISLRVL